jgi:glycerol dehydrogenase
MLSIFCAPARYTQGKNATEKLGEEITRLGLSGPALIISSPSPIKQLGQVWKKSLGEAGIAYQVYTFKGESSRTNIAAAAKAAEKLKARLVIAAGGGKVIDTARAAADDLNLPIVSCPTIVATDAPTSAVSVIYDDAGKVESYRFFKRNPDLVLVDSQVIAQAPLRLFVAGIGDALSTWFEAQACRQSQKPHSRGGVSTLAALTLARLCYDTIRSDGAAACRAVSGKVVTPQLERVIEANTLLSGLGFESSGLAAAHSIHNGLTVVPQTHDYYHGEKVAIGVCAQLFLEKQPTPLVEEVYSFCAQVGLPVTLAQVGIKKPTDALLKQIAQRATAPGESIHNEPFAVTSEMVVDAIKAADTFGRAYLR